jgi:hypothetical protein
MMHRSDSSAILDLWNFVEDVDNQDSTLTFQFTTTNELLYTNFNPNTGRLILSTAPNFNHADYLYIKILDDSNAYAQDTLKVIVFPPAGIHVSYPTQIPDQFALLQNYPNPFNPHTTIRYALKQPEQAHLVLYDILGRVVRVLVNERQKAGWYTVEFDGSRYASGTYFYKLTAGPFTSIRKLMLIK